MSNPIDATRDSVSDVLGLLDRQVSLYGKLETLAQKQRALITNEDTAPLLKVLAQRQRLTTALQEINDQIAPFRSDWPRFKQSMAPIDRARVEELVRQANERLGNLLDQDEQDVRMLSARKQRVGSMLKGVCSGKQAIAAYKRSSPATARLDRTHEES